MVKKVFFVFAAVLVVTGVTYVSAVNISESDTLSYLDAVNLSGEISADFTSSIESSDVVYGPVTVENTIQRKNFWGNWVNEKKFNFEGIESNQVKSHEFSLSGGKELTRSIWCNMTSDSIIKANFSISSN